MSLVSFWLDLGFFFNCPNTRHIGITFEGLPSFTKPKLHAHPDFEDYPGKILLWGNINLSSPIKYLSFDII